MDKATFKASVRDLLNQIGDDLESIDFDDSAFKSGFTSPRHRFAGRVDSLFADTFHAGPSEQTALELIEALAMFVVALRAPALPEPAPPKPDSPSLFHAESLGTRVPCGHCAKDPKGSPPCVACNGRGYFDAAPPMSDVGPPRYDVSPAYAPNMINDAAAEAAVADVTAMAAELDKAGDELARVAGQPEMVQAAVTVSATQDQLQEKLQRVKESAGAVIGAKLAGLPKERG